MSDSVKSWCDACHVAFKRTGYGCDGHPMCTKPEAPEGFRLTGDKGLTDTGWREDVIAVADATVTAEIPTASGRWAVTIDPAYPEYTSGTSGFGRGMPSCEPPDQQRAMIAALRAQPGADHPVIAKTIGELERAIP